MRKTVPVEQSVGMVLPHDVTEIVKDVKKEAAFKKGHIIRPEDIEHLKRLGKENIYVLSLNELEIHENEAAVILADALSGQGVTYDNSPEEGKIALKASLDGLLRINKEALYRFNLLGEVMCATLHDNTPVRQGETVGATRLIPLIGSRSLIAEAKKIARDGNAIIRVHALVKKRIGLVITGNEVYHGRIEDRFEEVLRTKAQELGSVINHVRFSPDDRKAIAKEIEYCIQQGAEIIVTSGGMSVDPDDITREGILLAGAKEVAYGTPVLPGAMFLSGMIGKVPVLGLPACGMYHKITVFDLVLPRILTGQKIGRHEFAELGHGGLCRNCKNCQYPICNFGK